MAIRRQKRYKAEDIWHTPDDGYRYEVIDGVMLTSGRPPIVHQLTLGHLFIHLWEHNGRKRFGEMVMGPIGVVLDESNAVQPDLVYMSAENLDIISERGVFGVPTLILEVISPETRSRDRGIKLRCYEAAGVPHYWMLDPHARALDARRLVEDRYEVTGVYGAGDVFRPDLFPGLDLSIGHLFHSQIPWMNG
jgi:Uma2 family endonuclease